MKKFLLFVLTLFVVFIIFRLNNSKESFDLKYNEKQLKYKKSIIPNQNINIIEEINKNNSLIYNFESEINVYIKKGNGVNINGKIYYNKPKNFRLILNTIIEKEVDIGSNNNYFWFVSYENRNPILYYANHNDLDKSRLKTPFNPNWLIGTLGFSEINYKHANIDYYNNLLRITNHEKYQKKEVVVCVVIDTFKKCVIGKYIYDTFGKCICSSEILSFQIINGFNTPKTIKMIWYDENIVLNWTFNKSYVNNNINQNNFKIPNVNSKIDMGKD